MDFELQLYQRIPFPSAYAYEGCTYNGTAYFMTLPQCSCIHVYQPDFTFLTTCACERAYHAISYDAINLCFWASSSQYPGTLFCLDADLKEQSSFTLPEETTSLITGLSCDNENDTLLVSFADHMCEYGKNGRLLHRQAALWNSCHAILQYNDCFFFAQTQQGLQFLEWQSKDGYTLGSYPLTEGDEVVDILWDYEGMKDNDLLCFFLFVKDKHGCPCILKCCLKPCDCETERCDIDEVRCRLLSSIACMEAALSHVLNAEGEKLQKAVEVADEICALLEVNHSINQTITNITMLEQVLFAKLQVVLDIESCRSGCPS